MKKIQILILLFASVFSMISCSDDDDSGNTSSNDDTLINSIWFFKGEGCDVYYDFSKDSYLILNPCLGSNGNIELVAYEAGTYKKDSDKITLSVNQSCDNSIIGNSNEFNTKIESDILTISNEEGTLMLKKINSLPTLPDNVEYGYFDNDGFWKKVDSCSVPDGV